MTSFAAVLSREFSIAEPLVQNIMDLIDEGNTIPFIARYRKEKTGSCDDQVLRQLAERLDYLRGLEKRREEISAAIAQQGKLTEELAAQLEAAPTLARLEDIYRPYKQKRRTRATVAREKGLEPLARELMAQSRTGPSPEELAAPFVQEEKGVSSVQEALDGACDILAEEISDDAAARQLLRQYYQKNGLLHSQAVDPGADSV